MDTIKFGMRFWKKYLPYIIMAQILSFCAIVADLLLPLLSEMLVDYIILANDEMPEKGVFAFLLNGDYGKPGSFTLFYHIVAIFAALLITRLILIYIKNTTQQNMGLKMETDLRVITFHKLMEIDSATVAEYNTGELLQTMNSDTIIFKDFYSRMLPNAIDSVFVLITSIYLLSTINVRLLAIPVVLMPFFIIALMKFKKLARKNYAGIRANNSRMNLTVQENIEAVRLVRSFTNEELEKKKFDASNDALKDSHVTQIRLTAKFEVIFSTIKQIAYIGSIAISAVLVIKGYMLVGFLVACSNYVMKIMDHISQINNMIFNMQQQLVAGSKIMNFMNCESKIVEKEPGKIVDREPNISIHNASLVLDDYQILKDINLDIPYGKKVGIVGGTGSGKSMLLKTLVRIHDMTQGEININGTDIREYNLKDLRNQYSYVFQDVFLFSNTVDSNIAFSNPDVEEELVQKAAAHAQAHPFIRQLMDGYDTIVGERGLGLSGGQKQRVSIARALLKNAPVLVLDDSTSALDVTTEKRLLAELKENYPDKTLLISAHRLSSVEDCDEIIYMQDGEIVERGTFKELLDLKGHFAEVYEIQESERRKAVDYDNLNLTMGKGGN